MAIINHVPSDLDNNTNYFVHWMHEMDGEMENLSFFCGFLLLKWYDGSWCVCELICVSYLLPHCGIVFRLNIYAFTKHYLTAIFVVIDVVWCGVANILFLILSLSHVSHVFDSKAYIVRPLACISLCRCDDTIFFPVVLIVCFYSYGKTMFRSIFHLQWLSVFICKFHIWIWIYLEKKWRKNAHVLHFFCEKNNIDVVLLYPLLYFVSVFSRFAAKCFFLGRFHSRYMEIVTVWIYIQNM